MKRKISGMVAGTLAVTMLASCGGNSTSGTEAGGSGATGDGKSLNIWSFTNEGQTFATAYQEQHPDVKVSYTMIPMNSGEYQQKLQQTLANGTDVPDVVFLEESFVRQYVESPYLADLDELLPQAEAAGTFQFTIDAGTNPEGKVKAFSYQAAPGAVFYRRSLAKEYFGTDDPEQIQAMMSDMDGYTEMAKVVKEKSGGNTYMVSSTGDFKKGFVSARKDPWVVDGKLVVDPKVEELFETSKLFRENGYEAQSTQWTDSWFSGMNDTLVGSDGQPKQVFTYWLPTWGLPYTLMPNAKTDTTDTSGDWGIVTGPLEYAWGGTWLATPTGAKNPELAKDFIAFATLNEDTLTNWATGKYTNEYLKGINPEIGDLFQGPGDFVSSKVVVDKISSQFDDAETSSFVGGQNSYTFFGQVAPNLNLEKMQGTDDIIDRTIQDPLDAYASGTMTYDEAMASFKENLQAVLPDLIIE